MNNFHPYWLIIISAGIAALPLLATFVTSYLKVSIVLSMLRSALGTQQVPGNIVIMALSLGLSLVIMAPTLNQSVVLLKDADLGVFDRTPSLKAAQQFMPALNPWREFLGKHAGRRELKAVRLMQSSAQVKEADPMTAIRVQEIQTEDGLSVLLLAFMLTELKEAFAMGFVLLLPFLVIDLVVANVLAGMGMYMVSPVMISLPLKLLLFVLADGWLMLSKSLIESYV